MRQPKSTNENNWLVLLCISTEKSGKIDLLAQDKISIDIVYVKSILMYNCSTWVANKFIDANWMPSTENSSDNA